MSQRAKIILTYSTVVIVGLFFLFFGLVKARSFLAPLSVGALLAMIILPVCRWFEKKGLSRGWASFFSDLLVLLFFIALAGVVAAQVKTIAEDWPQIKKRIEPKVQQLQEFVADKTGLSIQEQNQKLEKTIPGDSSGSGAKKKSSSPDHEQKKEESTAGKEQNQAAAEAETGPDPSSGNSLFSSAWSFLSKLVGFLGTFLLIFVYIFFFLLYRRKFKNSILKFVPERRRDLGRKVIRESSDVSQNYLFGRLLLILFLAIIYSTGLALSGVKQAILISILAAVLSLIPYIGNIIGFFLAIAMAFFSGSGAVGALGVTITFAIAQFVESYILEPYLVGDKVNLNPVVTIIVVVLGGAVWGIVGMLISIPAVGILKVVCDHIPALHPLGYFLGEEDIGDEEEGKENIFSRTKSWAQDQFKR